MDFNNLSSIKADPEIVYLLTEYDNISLESFPLEVNDISIQTNNYFSLGFTYAREIIDGLTVGIHPKVNMNAFGLKSDNVSYIADVNWNGVDYDYDVRIEGDIYAGLPVAINEEAVGTTDIDYENLFDDDWDDNISMSDIWKNKTVSFDLGASYEYNKWSFSASILNLGSSKWKGNTYKLSGSNDVMQITKLDKLDYSIPTKTWLSARYKFSEKMGCRYRPQFNKL